VERQEIHCQAFTALNQVPVRVLINHNRSTNIQAEGVWPRPGSLRGHLDNMHLLMLSTLSVFWAIALSAVYLNRNRIKKTQLFGQDITPKTVKSEDVAAQVDGPSIRSATQAKLRPRRIIVAITGATGAAIAVRVLELLRDLEVETHLIISKWAIETIKLETTTSLKEIKALASFSYSPQDAAAGPSSGSFQTDGMIIVPCSMRTLSAVRTGFAGDLICRAADVTIKEQRKLVLVVRETPLSVIHLENMLALARQNVVIFPPMPAFYTNPKSVEDLVDQTSGRILDMIGFEAGNFKRWSGMSTAKAT
jgi:flavin prenyltransferase